MMKYRFNVTDEGIKRSIIYFEDARDFVKGIEDGKYYDAFNRLFPTPGMLDTSIDTFSLAEYNKYCDLFDSFQSEYGVDILGSFLLVALHQCHLTAEPMSRVYFPSIEALIPKDSSGLDTASTPLETADLLKDGFGQEYIDPHHYVQKIACRITQNMNDYCNGPHEYVAPYTSLVTSSMMGKTRLMKELARYLPVVYMCFRSDGQHGYPPPTANLLAWFEQGACGSLGIRPNDLDIVADVHYIIPTLKHSLFFLYLFRNLADLINDLLDGTSDYGVTTELMHANFGKNFEWMWQFFADHTKPFVQARLKFWHKVETETVTFYALIRQGKHGSQSPREQESSERPKRVANWAQNYLDTTYRSDLCEAHQKLCASFVRVCPELPLEPATLIVCFDEARHLCTSSAIGPSGTVKVALDKDSHSDQVSFSNFKAGRRALRYLRLADPIPRVFGLYTDITSRLTNFQPRALQDPSLRTTILPIAGTRQFKPIHIFTSIDAHSRMTEDIFAISDPQKVAEVERLVKFGRAGWYSLCSAKSTNLTYWDKEKILQIAISKLLGLAPDSAERRFVREVQSSHNGPTPRETSLRLLAVLSPRLALAAGPFSSEAVEMVSSHLAVVLRSDEDRHFINTYYPSEPILGEASAVIMKSVGWGSHLRALYQHMKNGIVTAGYRGELLSKVLCLMAMDDTPKPLPTNSKSPYWKHTQPVKVRDFLDSWLAPPGKYPSFSAALCDTPDLNLIDMKEFQRFLDGHVFFNHFIRLDSIVSIRTIVHAWNRGAAIMTKEMNDSFDHVIPVMLAAENEAPTFGQMYQEWNDAQKQQAYSNVSYIFINSKNYASNANHNTAADECRPKKHNFVDYKIVNGSKVVYLAIAQGFGKRQWKESHVNIIGRGRKNTGNYRQIKVVLKGIGPDTYKCLQHSATPDVRTNVDYEGEEPEKMEIEESEEYLSSEESDSSDEAEQMGNSDKEVATKYLRMLRTANLNYVEVDEDKESLLGLIDFVPLVYSEAAHEKRVWVQEISNLVELDREAWGKEWENKFGKAAE